MEGVRRKEVEKKRRRSYQSSMKWSFVEPQFAQAQTIFRFWGLGPDTSYIRQRVEQFYQG